MFLCHNDISVSVLHCISHNIAQIPHSLYIRYILYIGLCKICLWPISTFLFLFVTFHIFVPLFVIYVLLFIFYFPLQEPWEHPNLECLCAWAYEYDSQVLESSYTCNISSGSVGGAASLLETSQVFIGHNN